MFGISLADAETPLSSESRQQMSGLGLQALRFKLSVLRPEQISRTMDSLTGYSGTLLAVLDFPPSQGLDIAPQVRALVKQLKDRIQHWEIGSDPDDAMSGWPTDDLVHYAACLQKLSAAIHAEDPSAQVHNGGLGRTLPKGIARLYALGAGADVDIWNVHPYMNPVMPDAIGALRYFHDVIRKTIDQHGDRAKPVWWTSIGCPGMLNPKDAADWWLGKNTTELVQADWIKTMRTQVPAWGVQAVFWQDLTDHPGVTSNGRDYLGLFTAEGKPKMATTLQ